MRLILFLAGVQIVAMLPVYAQTTDPENSQERLKEIEQKLQENTRTAEEIEAEAKRQELELLGLRARLIETAESLKQAESDATALEKQIADLTAQEVLARGRLAVQQRSLSETLAALQSLEISRPPALAVSPQDAAEAARAAMALSTAAPELADRAANLRAEIENISVIQKNLDGQKNSLRLAERELTARRNVMQELLTQKEAENQQAFRRAEALRQENKRLADEATSIRDLIGEIENAKRTPIPAPRPSPLTQPDINDIPPVLSPELNVYALLPANFKDARGKIPLPVSGSIAAAYGSLTKDGGKLEGIQLETRSGAVVTAPFAGRIVFAGPLGLLGNVSILDVGDGYHLVFVGLDRISTLEGSDIAAGEPIGTMPSTVSRPSLEFQIRRNKEPLDPKSWLLKP